MLLFVESYLSNNSIFSKQIALNMSKDNDKLAISTFGGHIRLQSEIDFLSSSISQKFSKDIISKQQNVLSI